MKTKNALVIFLIIDFNINSQAQFGNILKKKNQDTVTDTKSTKSSEKSGSSFFKKHF